MGQRKAAFELSMGFIITVIFAVVLLTLALLFIQGFFGSLNDQREKWKQLADQELESAFAESEVGFHISPDRIEEERNTFVSVTAGIKNSAQDGGSHKYTVNIIVQNAPDGVSERTVERWIEYEPSIFTITPNGNKKTPIDIKIPSDAKAGSYSFEIIACTDTTPDGRRAQLSAESCNPNSPNIWGGSSKTFTLRVKT